MKSKNTWNYAPYLPADRKFDSLNPFVCRLAPGKDSCEVEWLGKGDSFSLYYSIRGQEDWQDISVNKRECCLRDLKTDTEYELFVMDGAGRKSPVRLLRTGENVGIVVNYLHPEDGQYGFSGQYLCSPSILRLPGGALLASMDVFAGNAPQNLTLLFRSDDGGLHWRYVTDIFPCFWGKMFWHKDRLYMLGVSREYGDLLIGASDDEGRTWSTPTVLSRGSSSSIENGHHRAPTVVLNSHGRLWTGTEYGSWKNNCFAASLLSVDENADLLDAQNWTFTDFVRPDVEAFGEEAGSPGGIEGNAVELPDGRIVDLLRFKENKAILMEASPDDPEEALVLKELPYFPLAHTKFEVARHASGVYYALGNPAPGRNILSLYASSDFVRWDRVQDIINHAECSIKDVGFQYPVFCFEGNDMLLLSRTAWNQAHNFHDSNCITFHRITIG